MGEHPNPFCTLRANQEELFGSDDEALERVELSEEAISIFERI